MRIDRYQPCPCGSGKKVKFCCPDIVDDLSRVARMLDGDQRLAALETLNQAIAKKGGRPGFLALKASVHLQMKQLDEAEATIAKFLATSPDNPGVYALEATAQLMRGETKNAVASLQKAIERTGDDVSIQVYEAIGLVGDVLLSRGHYLAARAHYFMQAAISEEEESEPATKILQLQNSRDVPLLFKDDQTLATYPKSTEWSAEGAEAADLEERGAWLNALDKLKQIRERYPNEPSVLKNIAILESWLGDVPASVQAYHDYARHESLPLEEAVEAEALAQVQEETDRHQFDVLKVAYPIKDNDVEKFQEVVFAHEQILGRNIDPGTVDASPDGGPAPRAVLQILDRPMPENSEGLTRDSVPRAIATAFLYGKETDRDARLELVITRSDDFQDQLQRFLDIAGEYLESASHEAVVHQTPKTRHCMALNWAFPDGASEELRIRLSDEQRAFNLLNVWPDIEQTRLDGKTPNEVADDPDYRIPLLASILLLELFSDRVNDGFDFNELRAKLDLPKLEEIDPSESTIKGIPTLRLQRIMAEKLDDNQLLACYTRSAFRGATRALSRFANEVIRRESLAERVNVGDAYAALARIARTTDESLEHLGHAIAAARRSQRPVGPYLVAELEIRVQRGDQSRAQDLINVIQRQHLDEPGVAQSFYTLLTNLGVMHPEQQHVSRLRQMKADERRRMTEPAPAEPQSPASQIWTPDNPQPASAGSGTSPAGGGSKIWTPGAD